MVPCFVASWLVRSSRGPCVCMWLISHCYYVHVCILPYIFHTATACMCVISVNLFNHWRACFITNFVVIFYRSSRNLKDRVRGVFSVQEIFWIKFSFYPLIVCCGSLVLRTRFPLPSLGSCALSLPVNPTAATNFVADLVVREVVTRIFFGIFSGLGVGTRSGNVTRYFG